MNSTILYTIGFTKKTAEQFFSTILAHNISLLIDVRLNNTSQLAAFAKIPDLEYFLRELCDCEYLHVPSFAPTRDILDDYKKKRIDWLTYESRFTKLIKDRGIENHLCSTKLANACLLCSEPQPEKCHRRLVAEYLRKQIGNIEIRHL